MKKNPHIAMPPHVSVEVKMHPSTHRILSSEARRHKSSLHDHLLDSTWIRFHKENPAVHQAEVDATKK